MAPRLDDRRDPVQVETSDQRGGRVESGDWQLHRWQVSFRSGASWYSIGEFVALDAAGAIERAVAVFGPGEEHKAEEIPWDAAPLPRMNPAATRAAR
jgi:hypothetical protein